MNETYYIIFCTALCVLICALVVYRLAKSGDERSLRNKCAEEFRESFTEDISTYLKDPPFLFHRTAIASNIERQQIAKRHFMLFLSGSERYVFEKKWGNYLNFYHRYRTTHETPSPEVCSHMLQLIDDLLQHAQPK